MPTRMSPRSPGLAVLVDLGTDTLTFGSNNTNTLYAGTFEGGAGGTLAKTGTGTTFLTGDSSTWNGGAIEILDGILRVEHSGALGDGTNTLTFGGGVLSAGADLNQSGAVTLEADGTVDVDAANAVTLSGVISESGGSYGLNKTGDGRLNLDGANTFTGASQFSGGSVGLGTDTALGTTSGVSVTADTTILSRGGDRTIDRNFAMNAATTLRVAKEVPAGTPGDMTLSGVLSGAGGVRRRRDRSNGDPLGRQYLHRWDEGHFGDASNRGGQQSGRRGRTVGIGRGHA